MSGRPWMIALLLIMAVVCSTALALVNLFTLPIIEENERTAAMGTVLDVFGIHADPADPGAIADTYATRIEEDNKDGLVRFKDRETGRIALKLEGSGFQGLISVVVALEGEKISGFRVIRQDETPGLGARILEPSFQEGFVGKRVTDGIRMIRTGTAGEGEFDAITGATETSRAIERILNTGLRRYFAEGK